MPQLEGAEFEAWLFDPEHAKLPDFLAMPSHTFGSALMSSDIKALRALARGRPGGAVPPNMLNALARLHLHNIIARIETEKMFMYVLTPYSFEVLLHNVSYREAPDNEQLV